MSTSFLLHFNEDGCTNLYQWVRDIVPAFVCDIPVVHHIDPAGEKHKVSDLVISANIQGIKRAWGLARGLGESTLSYQLADNTLIVRPGLFKGCADTLGQVGKGLYQTYLNNNEVIDTIWPNSEVYIANFYGIQNYIVDRGYSIITPQLACLISTYIKQIYTIVHRVENSYGSLISIEGLDMGDEPLLELVQDKINTDWDKTKRIQAPGGSKLGEIDIALTDTDKMLIPLEDAIATESQVPRELLFPNKAVGDVEMEKLAIWARKEFMVTVAPALWGILSRQGYREVEITPPTYRDVRYNANVENIKADTLYKMSAAERNKTAKAVHMGRKL